LKIGAVNFKQIDLISIGLSIVLLLAVAFILTRTRIGKATRAVSDNKSLAAASGINVERIIRIVWTGAGALAGLSGALIGYYQTLRWDTGASVLLLAFAAVTLGGFGTAFGALVGSIIIGLLVNLSTLILPSNVQNATALVVMILILLVRPQGIFGRRERIG
jgi:branched-chain amino acid transport system permease protein